MPDKLIDRFDSLSEISRLINSSEDLDTILEHIVYALCAHSNWSMSSVLRVDEKVRITEAVKRFDPYQNADKKVSMAWDLSTSPVAEVVRTKQPLIITDAMETKKYPTYRKDARIRGYRTTVILPLLATDGKGRPMVLSVQSRDLVDVSVHELRFLRMASDFASIAVEKTVRIEAEKKVSARLRRSVDVYAGIMQPVIEGGSLLAVADELNRMLEQPWLIVDLLTHEIVAPHPPECFTHGKKKWKTWIAAEGKRQFLSWSRDIHPHNAEKESTLILDVDGESISCGTQISPLVVDGEVVGVLYLFVTEEHQDNIDRLQMQSVQLAMSAMFMRNVVGFRSTVYMQDEIVRQLLAGDWEKRGDFIARASAAGIQLNQPLQMLFIASIEKKRRDATPRRLLQLTARLVKKLFDGYATVKKDGMMISLIPACDRDNVEFSSHIQQVQKTVELDTSNNWILMLSEPCDDVGEFGQMLRRCKRLINLARSLGTTGLVSTQYFGALPLLLSMADNVVVEEFLEHTIYRIVRDNPKNGNEYLNTMRSFVFYEGRFQACANDLRIHVSTLRYRLKKLDERFGIDATRPSVRFDLQVAFQLLDLTNFDNLD